MVIVLDRQGSVPRQVYELLLEKIQVAELRPGQSVNERELAALLGISRTPIREAMRKLSNDGLLEIVPHVGTTVAQVDPRKVYECCLIRESLESMAAEEATKHFTPPAGRMLDRLIAEQEETIVTGDMVRNIAVDSEFHSVIHRLSGFNTMADVLRRVMAEVVRVRHLSIKLPGRLREPIEEHRQIVVAMRAGDQKRASAAMKRHIELSMASVMLVMDTHPEFLTRAAGK